MKNKKVKNLTKNDTVVCINNLDTDLSLNKKYTVNYIRNDYFDKHYIRVILNEKPNIGYLSERFTKLNNLRKDKLLKINKTNSL